MSKRAICIGILIFGNANLLAAQGDHNITYTESADDPNNPNIIKLLNQQLPSRHIPYGSLQFENKRPIVPAEPLPADGYGNVPKSQAMLCPVCKQPLWKHDLDGFECIPLDENGNPRKMLKIALQSAQCPLCKCEFQGALPEHINGKGGVDRDFCVHSIGIYTVNSNVWVCPECGYAALIDAFAHGAKPVDDAVKAYVRASLSEATRKRMFGVAGLNPEKVTEDELKFGQYINETQIPDWIKFDNAVKIYEQMKAPRGFLATLYRDAAHACRREVYSEISVPGLNGKLQETLGKSIRRMNRYLQEQCLNVRRAEGASVLDPTVMETDAFVLSQGVAEIVRLAEEENDRSASADRVEQGVPANKYFTSGDMYVLYIRYAGILDRLGKADEAEKALRRANSYIPEKIDGIKNSPETPGIEEAYARQLKLLHGVADDRLVCLQKEKDYLFSAAKANMSAIMFKEVNFVDDAVNADSKTPAGAPVTLDAAPASYLLGELFRRSGEPAAAAAWYDAAARIVRHRIELLDTAEKQNPESGNTDANEAHKAIMAKRGRWLTLQSWIQEQRALIKSPGAVDEHVRDAISRVLQSCGFNATDPQLPSSALVVKTDASATQPTQPTLNVASSQHGNAGTGTPMTREQLYKTYYTALIAYRQAKGQNPPHLIDIVKAGLLSAEDAHLDDKGKLICPETGEKLLYSDTWEKGDATTAVLLPMSSATNSKTLYANGEIRERGNK